MRNFESPVFFSGLIILGVCFDSGKSGYINVFKKLVCAALWISISFGILTDRIDTFSSFFGSIYAKFNPFTTP